MLVVVVAAVVDVGTLVDVVEVADVVVVGQTVVVVGATVVVVSGNRATVVLVDAGGIGVDPTVPDVVSPVRAAAALGAAGPGAVAVTAADVIGTPVVDVVSPVALVAGVAGSTGPTSAAPGAAMTRQLAVVPGDDHRTSARSTIPIAEATTTPTRLRSTNWTRARRDIPVWACCLPAAPTAGKVSQSRRQGWCTRPKPARSSHQMGTTETVAPVWGASTMRPPPTYIPTW
jgi:hypothetical protein